MIISILYMDDIIWCYPRKNDIISGINGINSAEMLWHIDHMVSYKQLEFLKNGKKTHKVFSTWKTMYYGLFANICICSFFLVNIIDYFCHQGKISCEIINSLDQNSIEENLFWLKIIKAMDVNWL